MKRSTLILSLVALSSCAGEVPGNRPQPQTDGGSLIPLVDQGAAPALPDLPGPPPSADAGAAPKLDSGQPSLPNDADGDGVPDAQDLCSHTPAGQKVWTSGSWIGCGSGQYKDVDDPDRDGVPSSKDQCPGTPLGTVVETSGANAGCPPGADPPPPPPPPPADSGPPPPADSGAPGFTLSVAEKDLLDAINAARTKLGLSTVQAESRLTCAARMHATDYTGGCDHTGSDGSWPWDRAVQCGYPQPSNTVNEICAGPGFVSGTEAVWGWQQSSGHWAALTHTQAKYVGLGVGTNGCYVALFDCCVASF